MHISQFPILMNCTDLVGCEVPEDLVWRGVLPDPVLVLHDLSGAEPDAAAGRRGGLLVKLGHALLVVLLQILLPLDLVLRRRGRALRLYDRLLLEHLQELEVLLLLGSEEGEGKEDQGVIESQ